MIAISVVLLVGIAVVSSRNSQGQTDRSQLDFLTRHWQLPVAPQGEIPPTFSALEASLEPASCGGCHPTQYADWQTTVHSRSVGPGLLGQNGSFLRDDPETAVMCYTCHAPLSEQQEVVRTESGFTKNPSFDAGLQRQGLTCAGCHVRHYQRFGPPRRDGSLVGSMPADQAPHGGATRTAAFERAEFCMGCHQFETGDRALNGKLIENTYNEWKRSPYAAQGIACQSCHMPDRRHLWRGIHDREMVQRGVSVDLRVSRPQYAVGERVEATLILTNRGVGHYFPSYVTPKVTLKMELRDAAGHPIPGSLREEVVGREVSLDLSEELFDTRIPPKGIHTMTYGHVVDRKGLRLRTVVIVHPDDFYRRFYEAKLAGQLAPDERKWLTQAVETARRSSYTILEKEIPVS